MRDTLVTLSGTVKDQKPTQVRVNGTVATMLGSGSFSAAVRLAPEGANTITISAIDAAANCTDSTRTVLRET
ncbi:MAG: hypothetical protein ACR2M1_16310 [Gemmatimonadaceae bacterium]